MTSAKGLDFFRLLRGKYNLNSFFLNIPKIVFYFTYNFKILPGMEEVYNSSNLCDILHN